MWIAEWIIYLMKLQIIKYNSVDSTNNVAIRRIKKQSPALAELDIKRKIKIIGAMYYVNSGKVDFF